MNRHPGGEEHTRRMLKLAALPEGAKVLDLGAGAGESVALMRALGYDAAGIDLEPRSDSVQKGDLLHTGYPDGSFDGVFPQRGCARRVPGELSAFEARRGADGLGRVL